jgi:alpha-D-ribose 1-methylphosphonate 5-triphosphate synthase subunit PhnI
MYVAVKGGSRAIAAAHALLAIRRRGPESIPELASEQIGEQLTLAVDRVQAEGSLYAPALAAEAVKRARGDLVEAVFLLRARRATIGRLGPSLPLETKAMIPERRISATFKDLPGGLLLGPTFDYTHRLLGDEEGIGGGPGADGPADPSPAGPARAWSETPEPDDFLVAEGLLESEPEAAGEPPDLTAGPLELPADRRLRLQALARADEGFLLAMAYSWQRGYGSGHPFITSLKIGAVEVEAALGEPDLTVPVARIIVTEATTANPLKGGGDEAPTLTRGYGLVFGRNERKAISMAICDRALRSMELGERLKGPAQDEEFMLYHGDNVEASGFVSHLKLPHHVDFQAELGLARALRVRPAGKTPKGDGPGAGRKPKAEGGQAGRDRKAIS